MSNQTLLAINGSLGKANDFLKEILETMQGLRDDINSLRNVIIRNTGSETCLTCDVTEKCLFCKDTGQK